MHELGAWRSLNHTERVVKDLHFFEEHPRQHLTRADKNQRDPPQYPIPVSNFSSSCRLDKGTFGVWRFLTNNISLWRRGSNFDEFNGVYNFWFTTFLILILLLSLSFSNFVGLLLIDVNFLLILINISSTKF